MGEKGLETDQGGVGSARAPFTSAEPGSGTPFTSAEPGSDTPGPSGEPQGSSQPLGPELGGNDVPAVQSGPSTWKTPGPITISKTPGPQQGNR